MNTRNFLCAHAFGFALLLPLAAGAARAASDLQPPVKRQASVDLAEKLARRTKLPAEPEDIVSPFNPPGFDKAEVSAVVAPVASNKPEAPPPPPGDRQILEMVAAQLNPTGTMLFEGTQRLVMGSKRFQVGDRFIVTMNNQDHELEI